MINSRRKIMNRNVIKIIAVVSNENVFNIMILQTNCEENIAWHL